MGRHKDTAAQQSRGERFQPGEEASHRSYRFLLNPHAGGFERRDLLFKEYGERSFAAAASDRALHNEGAHFSQGRDSHSAMKFLEHALPLASTPPSTATREAIGNLLYAKVHSWGFPDLAGKITGMLLDLDDEDLQPLLTNDFALREIVDEAREMLGQEGATSSGGVAPPHVAANDFSPATAPSGSPRANVDVPRGDSPIFLQGDIKEGWQAALGEDSDLETGDNVEYSSQKMQTDQQSDSIQVEAESALDFLLEQGVGRKVSGKEIAQTDL